MVWLNEGSSMRCLASAAFNRKATGASRRNRRRNSVPRRRRIPSVIALLEERVLMATFPLVTSIVRAVPLSQSTSATSVSYTVTFDQAVTGVKASDFQLTETNGDLQAQTPVVVTGSGTTYTVQVNGLHGSGDLRLDLVDDDSITNLSDDPLGGPGAGNGSFQGQTYAIDQADPVVLSINGTAPPRDRQRQLSLLYRHLQRGRDWRRPRRLRPRYDGYRRRHRDAGDAGQHLGLRRDRRRDHGHR